MTDEIADNLKEMTKHRGLKLVRSRRRKPGTGDYGKFGLVDEKGKEIMGFGDDGQLTASAGDIEDYLRAGAVSTWKQSASVTPDNLPAANKSALVREKREPTIRPRLKRKAAPSPRRKAVSNKKIALAAVGERSSGETREGGSPRAKPKLETVRSEPVLSLRPANPTDAPSIARLFAQLAGPAPGAKEVASNLTILRKAGGDMHLAEFGIVAGCIAWLVLPTPHRGNVGRITVLVVDESLRRRGFGTKLLAFAEAALVETGCTMLEAMSDIDIRNSHNFFRSSNFNQTSYRFVRAIEKSPKRPKRKG